ncbi:MAG: zinc-ribbon domain-containing protein [Oscillospiraceae bacterium]
MKTCPNCHNQLNDDAVFCTACGVQVSSAAFEQSGESSANQGTQNASFQNNGQPNFNPNQGMPNQPYNQPNIPPYDPFDHTSEFDPKDISDNKVFAMLVYLMGSIGIIIALLASRNSKFVDFHLRQALKFLVVEILIGLITVVLCWTIIVPIAAGIMYVVLTILEIICFFQVCSGKAKEAPIIRSLKFLK